MPELAAWMKRMRVSRASGVMLVERQEVCITPTHASKMFVLDTLDEPKHVQMQIQDQLEACKVALCSLGGIRVPRMPSTNMFATAAAFNLVHGFHKQAAGKVNTCFDCILKGFCESHAVQEGTSKGSGCSSLALCIPCAASNSCVKWIWSSNTLSAN